MYILKHTNVRLNEVQIQIGLEILLNSSLGSQFLKLKSNSHMSVFSPWSCGEVLGVHKLMPCHTNQKFNNNWETCKHLINLHTFHEVFWFSCFAHFIQATITVSSSTCTMNMFIFSISHSKNLVFHHFLACIQCS